MLFSTTTRQTGASLVGENQDTEYRAFVASALGGTEAYGERFTFYVPNKGRPRTPGGKQVELQDWKGWIRRALDVFGKINGGATTSSPVSGFYLDGDRDNEEVWEKTILVYSFIDREKFRTRISEVRKLLHSFGRDTNQGEVFFEFDGFAYCIRAPYDVGHAVNE